MNAVVEVLRVVGLRGTYKVAVGQDDIASRVKGGSIMSLLRIFLISLMLCAVVFANSEDEKFSKLVDEYLEFTWQLSPVNATFNGVHKYDDRLESVFTRRSEETA